MDWLPVVSQVKSLVQVLCGDAEGATQTQINFSRQCPVVSQLRSVVELSLGDGQEALETQKECGTMLNGLIDGIPIVGHAKGGIHYAFGDQGGGDSAMKSASRTTGVVAGGVGGIFVGGPAGAVVGGIAGGAVVDGMTTGIESAVKGKYSPSGYVAAVHKCVEEPGCKKAGAIFDLTIMPVADGFSGYIAGKGVQQLTKRAPPPESAPKPEPAANGRSSARVSHAEPIPVEVEPVANDSQVSWPSSDLSLLLSDTDPVAATSTVSWPVDPSLILSDTCPSTASWSSSGSGGISLGHFIRA